jgi:hypothetical protein
MDPDLDPDPPQNVMDPQHWREDYLPPYLMSFFSLCDFDWLLGDGGSQFGRQQKSVVFFTYSLSMMLHIPLQTVSRNTKMAQFIQPSKFIQNVHCKNKVIVFSVPSRDVINQTLPGGEL